MGHDDRGRAAVGVLMAGGEGRRMRAGGQAIPKPLVPVLGAPLVERNLWALLRAGLTDVRVVVGAGEAGSRVHRWASTRGARLATAVGARVEVVVEPVPLGNCGGLAVALETDDPRPAVLTFADNLTDLDLTALLLTMEATSASMVLAVHDELFRLPYGVVEVSGGTVSAYREKPDIPIRVGSGVAVVGAECRRLAVGPTGVVDLVNHAVAAHQIVVTHEHSARWVDVNDPSKVLAAEAMVRLRPDHFERWLPGASTAGSAAEQARGPDRPTVLLDDLDRCGWPVQLNPDDPHIASLSDEARVRVSAWRRAAAGGREQRT